MRGYNPTRRNRNIGTAKSGHGQDNRMTIPQAAPGDHAFWERIDNAREISRTISGQTLKFFVQQTRTGFVHACTVDDIACLMSHVPTADWEGIGAIVLRQPRRKEQTLSPVWGRLDYAADLVNRTGDTLYSGPAIVLEAICPGEPLEFGKGLGPDGLAEFERLKADGHMPRPRDRNHTLDLTVESCRTTQLYRTLPHEIGHWVDFLEKVERPHMLGTSDDSCERYGQLSDLYHSRPASEKEQFANDYANRLRRRLTETKVIPFDRQLDCQRLQDEQLQHSDFVLS